MNNLQIFNNNEFGEIRTVLINNEPYFMLSDVCRVLGIKNPSQAKTRLSDLGVISNEVGVQTGFKKDGTPAMQNIKADFINESNLYKLIFQSRKPRAEKFSEWVTSEVLPTIRKTGAYMTDDTLEKALTNPDFLIELAIKLKKEKEEKELLQKKIENDKTKVLLAESIESSIDSIPIGDFAKILKKNQINIGEKRLFEWFRNNGYLMKTGESKNLPTQRSVEKELFEVIERTIIDCYGNTRIVRKTKIIGKGQKYFINRFLGTSDYNYSSN